MEARRCQSHAKGGRQQLLSSAEHAADKYCLAMPVSLVLQCLEQDTSVEILSVEILSYAVLGKANGYEKCGSLADEYHRVFYW